MPPLAPSSADDSGSEGVRRDVRVRLLTACFGLVRESGAMNDIVERLRREQAECLKPEAALVPGIVILHDLTRQAADEIERMSAALRAIREWAVTYRYGDDQFEEDKGLVFDLANNALGGKP